MILDITPTDIATGVRRDDCRCPLARALRRYGARWISVSVPKGDLFFRRVSVRVSRFDSKQGFVHRYFEAGESVWAALNAYDCGAALVPMSVELEEVFPKEVWLPTYKEGA